MCFEPTSWLSFAGGDTALAASESTNAGPPRLPNNTTRALVAASATAIKRAGRDGRGQARDRGHTTEPAASAAEESAEPSRRTASGGSNRGVALAQVPIRGARVQTRRLRMQSLHVRHRLLDAQAARSHLTRRRKIGRRRPRQGVGLLTLRRVRLILSNAKIGRHTLLGSMRVTTA